MNRLKLYGAMSVSVGCKSTEEVHDFDSGDSEKKVTEESNEKFIRNAEEIDVFLRNALTALTLK